MIWILRRYVSLEFLRWFFFCLAGFVAIAVVVDTIEKSNHFLKHKASFDEIARYTAYQLPEFISYMIAPSALMAMLIALAGMSKRNEVTAILAGGVGRRSIVAPMALLALVTCGIQFALSEYVVPEANAQKRFVLEVQIKGKSFAKFRDRRNRWFYVDGGFLRIDAIDSEKNTLHGVLWIKPGEPGEPPTRVEGEVAEWLPEDKTWRMVDTRAISIGTDGLMNVTRQKIAPLPVSIMPSDLAARVSKTEEWSVRDLRKIIRDRRRLGQDVVKERVDLYGRYSLPLAGFVMGLIGAPFAFREHRRGGAATGLFIGLVIGFAYYVVYAVGLSIGKSGSLPPEVAAWLPNVVFGGTGLYLSATLDRL